MSTTHVVALSGGKDSTALALELRERHPEIPYVFLFTPTGDELPEMVEHLARLETLLETKITMVSNGTLKSWIQHWKALPNFRQRWCTRVLKIEPCLAWLRAHQPAVLYVGLRADEEARQGLYSQDVETRFPFREWGWGLPQVLGSLQQRGIKVPSKGGSCARCPFQRLDDWRWLHQHHPDIYADAEGDEAWTGQTFRSPGRDSKPAALRDLKGTFQLAMVDVEDEADEEGASACRVCRL